MTEVSLPELVRQLHTLRTYATAVHLASGLPILPPVADDALLRHLMASLQALQQTEMTPGSDARAVLVARATQELRATTALLQEWLVPD